MCRVLGYLGQPGLARGHPLRGRQRARAPELQPAHDGRVPEPRGLRHGRVGRAVGPRRRAVHVPRPDDAELRPQPAQHLPQARARPACSRTCAASRGTTGEVISDLNLHPFRFPGAKVVMAHNGHLRDFDPMRYDLLEHVHAGAGPAHRRARPTPSGSTPCCCRSSTIPPRPRMPRSSSARRSACSRSCATSAPATGSPPRRRSTSSSRPAGASSRRASSWTTAGTPTTTRCSRSTCRTSASGTRRAASYVDRDGEWQMLSSDGAAAQSLLIASEPLTADTSTWLELPEYSLLRVSREEHGLDTGDRGARCLTRPPSARRRRRSPRRTSCRCSTTSRCSPASRRRTSTSSRRRSRASRSRPASCCGAWAPRSTACTCC